MAEDYSLKGSTITITLTALLLMLDIKK